ncbi:MAG: C-type lectin domain-containing protein [Candidatus Nanoarchaeia archaeon]|nr:C-type lectin domain-containing protein [Candidatus Jingweiarchaeum tengchongense]
MGEKSVKNNSFSFLLFFSFFIFFLTTSVLIFNHYKVPKEVKAIIGQLNIDSSSGNLNFPSGIWTSDGKVGIGTTNPQQKLQVNGNIYSYLSYSKIIQESTSTNNYSEFLLSGWGQGAQWAINAAYTGSGHPPSNMIYKVDPGSYNTGAGLLRFDGNNKSWSLYTAPTSTGIGTTVSFTQLSNLSNSNIWFSPTGSSSTFYINSSNKVGIGTTSLEYKLDVSGNGRFTSTLNVDSTDNPGFILGSESSAYMQLGNANVKLYRPNSNRLYIRAENTDNVAQFASYGLYLPGNTNYNLYVGGGAQFNYSNSDNQVVIKTDGNIGIGTTEPVAKTDIRGSLWLGTYRSGSSCPAQLCFNSNGSGTEISFLPNLYNKFIDVNLYYFDIVNTEIAGYPTSTRILINNTVDSSFQVMSDAHPGWIPWFYIRGSNGYVGIGTTNPQANLDVIGKIKLNNSEISYPITLPNTYNTAQWVKVGTLTIGQNGKSAFIKVVSNNGYSANIAQNFEVYIRFKTSNGSSTNSYGFCADSSYQVRGLNSHFYYPGRIKWKANAAGCSATAYDLYMYMPTYTGDGSFYKVETSEGSWSHAGTRGQSDPGSDSNIVLSSIGPCSYGNSTRVWVDGQVVHCYNLISTGTDYPNAMRNCEAYGGNLVSIIFSDQNAQVAAFATNVWIGTATYWGWKPITGKTPLRYQSDVYSNFASGEPSGDGNCVEMYSNGSWNDVNCGSIRPYVCEKVFYERN